MSSSDVSTSRSVSRARSRMVDKRALLAGGIVLWAGALQLHMWSLTSSDAFRKSPIASSSSWSWSWTTPSLWGGPGGSGDGDGGGEKTSSTPPGRTTREAARGRGDR